MTREIVTQRGSCIASHRIVVDGARVGFMYREQPENPHSSGWSFQAGDESQEYCADAEKWGVYDVNTIANVDAGIVRFLDQPPGSVYVANGAGKLVRASESSVPEAKVFTIPDAEGESVLDAHWIADFPLRFQRRIEDTTMILWRPKFTIRMQGFGTRDESAQQVREKMERNIPRNASDLVREEDGGLWRITFRVGPALVALVWAGGQLLNLTCSFDEEADAARALAIARSVRRKS